MRILAAASGSLLRKLCHRLLDGLLPQRCLLCAGASGALAVCAACRERLPLLPRPACPVCAHPHTASVSAGLPCGHCLAAPPAFDASVAVYAYLHPVDELVQQLKYGRRLAGADFLGQALAAALPPLQKGDQPAITHLLPMPLAPARLAERGFNQALELAHPVARALALRPTLDAVVRVRATRPQAMLPWDDRPANVRRAFAGRHRLDGAHVLVIDDVLTTGATLDALARELKHQGAVRVSNLVVARALRH